MWASYLPTTTRASWGGVYDRQRAPRGARCLLSICAIFIRFTGQCGSPLPSSPVCGGLSQGTEEEHSEVLLFDRQDLDISSPLQWKV